MMSLDVKGLGKAQKLLKVLGKLGNSIRAVDLNAKSRQDSSEKNNAEILEHLAEGGRDFVTPTDETMKKITRALVDNLELEIRKLKTSKASVTGAAKKAAANAFHAAAMVWQEEITRRIKEQDWVGDGGDLSPEYAKYKENKYGFQTPIGVATGQVRDNVAPERRNLRLKT